MFSRWKRRRSGDTSTAASPRASSAAADADCADLPRMPAGLAAKLCFLLDWLNAHALQEDGLHRVPGRSSSQAELRAKVHAHDTDITALAGVVEGYGTHVVAGVVRSTLLKSYEPVCSYGNCVDFVHAAAAGVGG